jgi:integrase
VTAHHTRRAPTYLTWYRDGWYLRFKYTDSAGQVHWPGERSPWPQDWEQSVQWAPVRRAQLIEELEAKVHEVEVQAARSPTISELIDAYGAHAQQQGTRWDRESYRAKIIKTTIGDLAIDRLTPDRVRDWREELRATRGRKRGDEPRRPLSNRSLNAYLTDLKAALNLAVHDGRIPSNPIAHLKPLPEPYRQPEAMSVTQVAAVFRALDEYERELPTRFGRPAFCPIRGIVLAHYYTLQRTGAILRLRWEQVHLERGFVRILNTKSGKPTVVPIRGPLADYLKEHDPGPGRSGWVFPNPATGKPYTSVRNTWGRLIALANAKLDDAEQIPSTQRLYSFRHSGISPMLQAGRRRKRLRRSRTTACRSSSGTTPTWWMPLWPPRSSAPRSTPTSAPSRGRRVCKRVCKRKTPKRPIWAGKSENGKSGNVLH